MKLLVFAIAASAVLAAICIWTIDEPIARWIAAHDTKPAAWNVGIDAMEIAIGNAPWRWLGVSVLVAASLATLIWARSYAPGVLIVTTTHLLAVNLMMWGKLVAGRLRPLEWLAAGGAPGETFRRHGASFPSGHVALVGSIVIPIVVVWPRTWPLCAVVAFTMVARIAVDAHFVSDTLSALALVTATTWLCARVIERVTRR